jgi:folate-binding protein YgfZ
VTSSIQVNLSGYEAAVHQTALYRQATAGYVRIRGEDRQVFLQRQSTNDVRLLKPGRILTTVLTSATARILDVLTLILEPEEAIGAITLPGRGQETTRFLKSKIFFMDKVSVEDASQEFTQFDLIGTESLQVLERIGVSQAPTEDEMVSGKVSEADVRIVKQPGPRYRVLAQAPTSKDVGAILKEAGAVELTPEAYAVVRVEMGLPQNGHELTEDYTPLETGLEWTVSGDKGCYTGQEVIARQITYDKVTRQLVGLSLSGEVEAGARVSALEDNKNVGEITSYAQSPRFGHIALAIIRKPHHEPGTEVVIGDNGEDIHASVTPLPFTK